MSKRTPVAEQPTQIYGSSPVYHQRPGPPPPPPDIYVQAAPARRGRGLWLPFLLLVTLAILGVAVVAAAGFLVYRSPRILPGIHTLGVELGGLSEEDAAARLAASWQGRTITLDGGEGNRTALPPASLGLVLDAEATARA